ncbi:MAG: hypothetical protein CL610_05935 [Anaerolineaceae bacterium]|nr:hypothetical protein [Anaerolineaceae bacterium]
MIITFFDDPDHPLIEPETTPDDLVGSLVGGVDMGLAHALIEFCEGNADSHQRMATHAIYIGDEQAADDQIERREMWADLRQQALYAYWTIVRTRSN